jgi:predicted ArsR family transcriptional regulator
MVSIEYDYSSSLRKHTVRTRGVVIGGRGVVQHHAQQDGKPYNVYSLTRAAFERVSAQYPNMTLALS